MPRLSPRSTSSNLAQTDIDDVHRAARSVHGASAASAPASSAAATTSAKRLSSIPAICGGMRRPRSKLTRWRRTARPRWRTRRRARCRVMPMARAKEASCRCATGQARAAAPGPAGQEPSQVNRQRRRIDDGQHRDADHGRRHVFLVALPKARGSPAASSGIPRRRPGRPRGAGAGGTTSSDSTSRRIAVRSPPHSAAAWPDVTASIFDSPYYAPTRRAVGRGFTKRARGGAKQPGRAPPTGGDLRSFQIGDQPRAGRPPSQPFA